MWQIGIWEQSEGLAERVTSLAQGRGCLVRASYHPALLAGVPFHLLAVSPSAQGWAGAGALSCQVALIPGGVPALTRSLPARTVVSYGSSSRDTLALSSLEEQRAAVAIQREFTTLDGRTVERQELILPYDGTPLDHYLLLVGAGLLLGRLTPPGAGN